MFATNKNDISMSLEHNKQQCRSYHKKKLSSIITKSSMLDKKKLHFVPYYYYSKVTNNNNNKLFREQRLQRTLSNTNIISSSCSTNYNSSSNNNNSIMPTNLVRPCLKSSRSLLSIYNKCNEKYSNYVLKDYKSKSKPYSFKSIINTNKCKKSLLNLSPYSRNLTPMPTKCEKDNSKNDSDFRNAERSAVVMRRMEYNSKIMGILYTKMVKSKLQLFLKHIYTIQRTWRKYLEKVKSKRITYIQKYLRGYLLRKEKRKELSYIKGIIILHTLMSISNIKKKFINKLKGIININNSISNKRNIKGICEIGTQVSFDICKYNTKDIIKEDNKQFTCVLFGNRNIKGLNSNGIKTFPRMKCELKRDNKQLYQYKENKNIKKVCYELTHLKTTNINNFTIQCKVPVVKEYCLLNMKLIKKKVINMNDNILTKIIRKNTKHKKQYLRNAQINAFLFLIKKYISYVITKYTFRKLFIHYSSTSIKYIQTIESIEQEFYEDDIKKFQQMIINCNSKHPNIKLE